MNQSRASVVHGAGDGTFVDCWTGNSAVSFTAADLNRDGRLDLALAASNTNGSYVHLGKADGTYAASTYFSFGNTAAMVEAADLNGDGNPDLVFGYAGSSSFDVVMNTSP